MPWYIPALFTAFCWALSYSCAEVALKSIDRKAYLALSGTTNCIFWMFWLLTSKNKIHCYLNQKSIFWMILAFATAIAVNYLCISAIQSKSATHASIIETSYPLFCILIAFLATGQFQLSLISSIGAALVLIGMVIFILGSN
jgi:uncharacterized membrane protein